MWLLARRYLSVIRPNLSEHPKQNKPNCGGLCVCSKQSEPFPVIICIAIIISRTARPVQHARACARACALTASICRSCLLVASWGACMRLVDRAGIGIFFFSRWHVLTHGYGCAGTRLAFLTIQQQNPRFLEKTTTSTKRGGTEDFLGFQKTAVFSETQVLPWVLSTRSGPMPMPMPRSAVSADLQYLHR